MSVEGSEWYVEGERGTKSINVTIRMGVSDYEKLKRIATVNGTTISALIKKGVRELLASYTGEPTPQQLLNDINSLRLELAQVEQILAKWERTGAEPSRGDSNDGLAPRTPPRSR